MRSKRGQSILEYVIVLIAVIACIAWAATQFIANKDAGKPRGVSQLMQQSGKAMEAATGEIANIGK